MKWSSFFDEEIVPNSNESSVYIKSKQNDIKISKMVDVLTNKIKKIH